MDLFDVTHGSTIVLGTTFIVRDEKWELIGFTPGRSASSTGRVILKNLEHDYTQEFFPSVINAAIEKELDVGAYSVHAVARARNCSIEQARLFLAKNSCALEEKIWSMISDTIRDF